MRSVPLVLASVVLGPLMLAPAARGACELTIFAEPSFGGASSEATANQQRLED